MTVNKRKKNTRLKGSKTHSWGSMKKHRGKGNKGGAGRAGTGKRGDAKKPSIWKNTKYFGKYGFKKKGIVKKIIPINLLELQQKAEVLVANKQIQKKEDTYIVDIEKIGYNKVLGYGKLAKKFQITSPSFSKQAIEKIKAAGGEAIQPKVKEKKEVKKVEKPVKEAGKEKESKAPVKPVEPKEK
ncbi:50S ribosomal protein L15 [Candidatus Woesearchaeota archaeon]|nr:50S ribosomal protein L15 [Candidatus Woesearchaeota archaeon]